MGLLGPAGETGAGVASIVANSSVKKTGIYENKVKRL